MVSPTTGGSCSARSPPWYSWQDYHLDQLRDIASPTLIYLGDRDELNELDQAVEMYHAIPNAELAIIPQANHFIAFDQLRNPVVLEFLERHSR